MMSQKQPDKGRTLITAPNGKTVLLPSDMKFNAQYLGIQLGYNPVDINGIKTQDGLSMVLSYHHLAREIDGKICELQLKTNVNNNEELKNPDGDDAIKQNAFNLKASETNLLSFYSQNDSGKSAQKQAQEWINSNQQVFIQRIWTKQFNHTKESVAYHYWCYVLYTTSQYEYGNGWNLKASNTKIIQFYSCSDGGADALKQFNKWKLSNSNMVIQNIWTVQFNMAANSNFHYWYYVVYSKEKHGNAWNLSANTTKMLYWHSQDDGGNKTKDEFNNWLKANSTATVQQIWTEQFNRQYASKHFYYFTYVVYT
eukprot:157280_1